MLSYINKKGNEIEISLTEHAQKRFIERYNKIFPNKKIPYNDYEKSNKLIERYFSNTHKIKNFNKEERKRKKKYGKDTIFFRNNSFTFVVQNSIIKTIEISDKNFRYLNKK